MSTIVYDGKRMPEWHAWLMETGIEINPGAGNPALHEVMLASTRRMEDRLHEAAAGENGKRAEVALTMLPIVTAVRHVLVTCKLLAEGTNPYHRSLTREEWIPLLESELGNYAECFETAAGWGCNLGYLKRKNKIAYEITPLGAALDLTPYNE